MYRHKDYAYRQCVCTTDEYVHLRITIKMLRWAGKKQQECLRGTRVQGVRSHNIYFYMLGLQAQICTEQFLCCSTLCFYLPCVAGEQNGVCWVLRLRHAACYADHDRPENNPVYWNTPTTHPHSCSSPS